MGSYTSVSQDMAQKIMNLYDLGQVKKLRPLSLGISNSNYKVQTDSDSYLLKVSNAKNQDELIEEMNILDLLKKKFYPFSLTPFQTVSGKFTYQYQESYGVLFPFLEGIPPGPSDHTCEEIGQGLAQLHEIPWSQEEVKQLRPYSKVGDDLDSIKKFTELEECPEDFKSLYKKLLADKEELWFKHSHRQCLIHGDLYYDNTLFDRNSLNAILDFEQAGHGNMLLDLGISMSGTCLEKGRIIRPLIESYLKGYESVLVLNQEEKDLIDLSILVGLFSISLWRIHRFLIGDLSSTMKDSYKSLLYKAENFAETKGAL